MKKTYNKSLKQYTQLLVATLIMIGLQLAVTSVLSRAMSPENFGTYKLILNTNLLLQSGLAFGIPVTISYLLANDEIDIKQYAGIGLKVAIGSSLIGVFICIALMIVQLNTPLYIVDNIALIFSPLCIIPILVYYSEYLCIGTNRISLLSKLKVFIQVFLLCALLVCWLLLSDVKLWMAVCAYAIANITILVFVFRKIGIDLNTDKGILNKLLDTNKSIGLQTYIGSVFSIVSTRVMVVLLDAFITKGEYAIYSLAITISIPLGPLISTVGSVMYRKFSKLDKMSTKFILLIISTTIGTAVVYVIGINIFTPIIFGEYYRASINYACAIGIGSLLVGLGDVFNRFVLVKGKGKYIRNAAIVSGIVNIGIAAALIASMNTVGITIARVSSNLIYLLMMVIGYLLVSKHKKAS